MYSGARLLKKIAILHPHLTTSLNVAELALQTESKAQDEKAKDGQEKTNILDELSAIGNYTAVFHVTFNHHNHIGRHCLPFIFLPLSWFSLDEVRRHDFVGGF